MSKKLGVKKKLKIKSLPKLLILHCKRFEFDYESGVFSKINTKMQFQKEMDLNAFVSQKNIGIDYSYVLLGFIVHQGYRLDSGHYFAIINDCLSDNFFEFNDEEIYKARNNDNENYEGKDGSKSSAYILFYIRKDSIDELFPENLTPYEFLNKELTQKIESEKILLKHKMVKKFESDSKMKRNACIFIGSSIIGLLYNLYNENFFDTFLSQNFHLFKKKCFRDKVGFNIGIDISSQKIFLNSFNKTGNFLLSKNIESYQHFGKYIPFEESFNHNLNPIAIASSYNDYENFIQNIIYYFKNKIELISEKNSKNFNSESLFENICIIENLFFLSLNTL